MFNHVPIHKFIFKTPLKGLQVFQNILKSVNVEYFLIGRYEGAIFRYKEPTDMFGIIYPYI